jgi:hypothetical protein
MRPENLAAQSAIVSKGEQFTPVCNSASEQISNQLRGSRHVVNSATPDSGVAAAYFQDQESTVKPIHAKGGMW